jgi:hypothetical protein
MSKNEKQQKKVRFGVKAIDESRVPENAEVITLSDLPTYTPVSPDVYVDCEGTILSDLQSTIHAWSSSAPSAHYYFYNFTLPQNLLDIKFKPAFCTPMLYSAVQKRGNKTTSEWANFLNAVRSTFSGMDPSTPLSITVEVGDKTIQATFPISNFPKSRKKS